MNENKRLCQYKNAAGLQCQEQANSSNFCFWHDKNSCKKGDDVAVRLENHAKNNGLLSGLSLKYANLSNIDLVNHNQKTGYDFSGCDFYKADLSGAHLFNANFSDASLMKVDLRGANLHCVNLQRTNLLGIKWNESKIENVKIGKRIKQEQEAHLALKQNDIDKALDLFEQAEEIYRDIRKHAEHEGIFSVSGRCIQKELTMRRMQMPKFSSKRMTSKIIDLFCGYGEAPLRIVGISICMIIFCACLYIFTGLNYHGELQKFSPHTPLVETMELFFACLYYSVVTFTTLGYGDFTPIGLSRAIAAFEAFTGSFTIALFVVVFVKKMTR